MDAPLPKREYNMPPPGFMSAAKGKIDSPLQRELQKIRRELLMLAQRVEKLTTGQETA